MKTIYNGIVLPDDFMLNKSSTEPYYLKTPPKVIDINIGRQLFVDDFLYEQTNLTPTYHKAVKYQGNPVFFPQTPWEKDVALPVASPKSGGIWYDEREKIFKMWYEAGFCYQMAYAVSNDGINWTRPNLEIEPNTNKILTYKGYELYKYVDGLNYFRPDTTTVFMDNDTQDENQRYKLLLRNPVVWEGGIVATSKDGINWENFKFTSIIADKSTIFYNPFRKKWVYSIRMNYFPDNQAWRVRHYRECDDFLDGATWTKEEEHVWLECDELDKPHPYLNIKPQLYNVDAVGYESIMLGMFQIWYGPNNDVCEKNGVPKITELIPMYSRDGYNFTRPCRESIIGSSMHRGSWDRGHVQSVGGVTVINGDELWIYYSAYGGDENCATGDWTTSGMYQNGATGVAKLRRDGFVSLNGDGFVLTRLLTFKDRESMHININGKASVQILSDTGELLAESNKVSANSTDLKLDFNGFDISCLNGKPFRLKFLVQGELYSFRFADKNGDSHGARAAGVVK